MVTDQEYAQLSARAYAATDPNKIRLGDWRQLDWIPDRSYGFSAGVYQKGSDIVIAFAGTNERADWGWANGLVTLGFPSPQVMEAMLLYITTKRENPTANITFTGHSLGGGLASMMAVFFDRPATVFDHAPFELGARNLVSLGIYQAELTALGFSDPAFDNYWLAAPTVFGVREAQVTGIYLKGESLESSRGLGLLDITGTTLPPINPGSPVGATARNLHSMTLLASMMTSTAFADAVRAQPGLIALLFDASLYERDSKTSSKPDILTHLYSQQVGVPATPLLDRFAADLQRLGTAGTTAQSAIQKGLTVAAMEYYYFKDAASATALFTTSGNAVHFKYSDIGAAQYKSLPLLTQAVQTTLGANENMGAAASRLLQQDAWHIQTGTGGMNWTASDNSNDAVIGGSGVDTIDAGAGNDIVFGGAGNDFLTGGAGTDDLFGGQGNDTLNGGLGNDQLYGGTGNDTYQFTGQFGKDTIRDSDGLGLVQIDGQAIGTAKGIGERGAWAFDLGADVYAGLAVYDDARSSTGKRLVITKGSDSSDSITIDNFDLAKAQAGGYLGIKLDNTYRLAFVESGGSNVWGDLNFDPTSLDGQQTNIAQGNGKSFAVYLNTAAKAGDTVTLAFAGLGDKFNAVLGDRTVAADGAVITLDEGQTEIRFALVQVGGVEVMAEAVSALSVRYRESEQNVTSQRFELNLQDVGKVVRTHNGEAQCNYPDVLYGSSRLSTGDWLWGDDQHWFKSGKREQKSCCKKHKKLLNRYVDCRLICRLRKMGSLVCIPRFRHSYRGPKEMSGCNELSKKDIANIAGCFFGCFGSFQGSFSSYKTRGVV